MVTTCHRRIRLLASCIGLALATGACSIPSDTTATPITSVPYDLLETNTPTTAAAVAPEETDTKLVPYWVLADNRFALFPISRPTEDSPSLQDAYDLLVQGPNEADREVNPELITLVTPSLGAILPDNPSPEKILTITIDAESGFQDSANRELIGAQLVCTFLAFSSVDGVLMIDTDGVAIPLTGFNATPIEGPANATHFNDCKSPEIVEAEPTTTVAP